MEKMRKYLTFSHLIFSFALVLLFFWLFPIFSTNHISPFLSFHTLLISVSTNNISMWPFPWSYSNNSPKNVKICAKFSHPPFAREKRLHRNKVWRSLSILLRLCNILPLFSLSPPRVNFPEAWWLWWRWKFQSNNSTIHPVIQYREKLCERSLYEGWVGCFSSCQPHPLCSHHHFHHDFIRSTRRKEKLLTSAPFFIFFLFSEISSLTKSYVYGIGWRENDSLPFIEILFCWCILHKIVVHTQ